MSTCVRPDAAFGQVAVVGFDIVVPIKNAVNGWLTLAPGAVLPSVRVAELVGRYGGAWLNKLVINGAMVVHARAYAIAATSRVG